jgi:hypothetical protein|tara:strand:+ start:1813 stop:2040 length:228 start_codon:yes stop_codon:yes gene_type:complete
MKQFINDYRKFRQLARQEIGDIRESDILVLFGIYREQSTMLNPLAGLEYLFSNIAGLNPDDDENDDDPFSNVSGV